MVKRKAIIITSGLKQQKHGKESMIRDDGL